MEGVGTYLCSAPHTSGPSWGMFFLQGDVRTDEQSRKWDWAKGSRQFKCTGAQGCLPCAICPIQAFLQATPVSSHFSDSPYTFIHASYKYFLPVQSAGSAAASRYTEQHVREVGRRRQNGLEFGTEFTPHWQVLDSIPRTENKTRFSYQEMTDQRWKNIIVHKYLSFFLCQVRA